MVFGDGVDFLWLETAEKPFQSEEPPTQAKETHISRHKEELVARLIVMEGMSQIFNWEEKLS